MQKKVIKNIIIIILILFIILVAFYIFMKKYFEINKQKNANYQESINEIVNDKKKGEEMNLYIKIGDKSLKVLLENNSSAASQQERLEQNDITILMEDYANFEKVGELGFTLPRNDKYIKTEPGDVILYQGNLLTIYYDTNSWTFTKLGKIENITQEELKSILGSGNVEVTFSLNN